MPSYIPDAPTDSTTTTATATAPSHHTTSTFPLPPPQEEGLLGGVAGPRQPLEAAMYDFFTSRYGCRQAAELHLAAFLGAVRRFRSQHPKVCGGVRVDMGRCADGNGLEGGCLTMLVRAQ